MRIETELKLNFSDVLIRPKRSTLKSRKEVSLSREFHFRNSQEDYFAIPIMTANMDGVGTFAMAETLAKEKLFTCLNKNYSEKDLVDWINRTGGKIRDYWAYSLGITDDDVIKFEKVYSQVICKYVCIDVANGYSDYFVEFIKRFRDKYPNIVIIAGNVVTGEMVEELILNGVDIVKVGIGSGSVCTTRLKTGVGYPQLSAIMECADAAHGLNGHIIADGGCTTPGDVAKAFGAGADFVMLGGMLAGHNEGGGTIVEKHYKSKRLMKDSYDIPIVRIKKFVQFYGMSSKAANEKHFGGLKDYRTSEGREVMVPYRGNVQNTVQDILGGLRSACTYVGAIQLKNLSKCTTFIRCTDTHNRIYEKRQ